jgi:hypothetical protein
MTPAEARSTIRAVVAGVAADPPAASHLAADVERSAQVIHAAPRTDIPTGPPSLFGICFSHKQVCKGHQICNSHPKGAIE